MLDNFENQQLNIKKKCKILRKEDAEEDLCGQADRRRFPEEDLMKKKT